MPNITIEPIPREYQPSEFQYSLRGQDGLIYYFKNPVGQANPHRGRYGLIGGGSHDDSPTGVWIVEERISPDNTSDGTTWDLVGCWPWPPNGR